MLVVTHAQLSACGVKCPPILLVFGVTLVHVNLCLHTFTHMTVTLRGVGEGDYPKKLISAEKCIVSEKLTERLEKRY